MKRFLFQEMNRFKNIMRNLIYTIYTYRLNDKLRLALNSPLEFLYVIIVCCCCCYCFFSFCFSLLAANFRAHTFISF